jgi:Zn-dependent metalloprotease
MQRHPIAPLAAAVLLCCALPAAAAPSRGLLDEQAIATQGLLAQRARLGLGDDSGFTVRHAFTNPQGRTVVRLQQTFQGLRVWGGEAIAHLEADGKIDLLTGSVKRSLELPAAAVRIDADAATRRALRDLAPVGPLFRAPTVEAVIFPTRFSGGLELRRDPATGKESIDFDRSLYPQHPTSEYVRAWEIHTLLANGQDGHREMAYLIDAVTGAILRKWDERQSLIPQPAYTPAVGAGQSYYRGAVQVPTSLAADGSYAMVDTLRGSLPQPFAAAGGVEQIGLTTYYGYIDYVAGLNGFLPYVGHAGNSWGNGSAFPLAYDIALSRMFLEYNPDRTKAWPKHALDATGETAAVDAQYGLAMTWDFYKNVFGRNGIDDKGTSTMAIVHDVTGGTPARAFPMLDNAYWSGQYFGMVFGDGSYGYTDYGMHAVTELDVTGHELSHGVCFATANLIYDGESGGLNEGNSDIFGKMVQAYADGGGQGAHIPDFAANDFVSWEIGHKTGHDGGLRFMYKPSLDGISADQWFDGLADINVHYSSGPANRFFYFLAAGASSSPSSVRYSPYLPGGMAGLGNHKAAHIWYKALTEYLPSDADFAAARAASLKAVQALYGPGSDEEAAVMNAWAAVNVGESPGEAPRVRLRFPIVHGAGSWLDSHAFPTGILEKVRLYPIQSRVQLRVEVENATNKGVYWDVIWSGGGAPDPVGVINQDGTWTTPNFAFYGDILTVTAVSQQDTRQFALGKALLVQGDADSDGEIDALDLGRVAASWGVKSVARPSVQLVGGFIVTDWDIVFSTESMASGWPVNQ